MVFRRRQVPRGRHRAEQALGVGSAEQALVLRSAEQAPLGASAEQAPVLAAVRFTPVVPAPRPTPTVRLSGVQLTFQDGTAVELTADDPRARAFRLVARELVRGR